MTNERREPIHERAEDSPAPTSERIVLNDARAAEDEGFFPRMAEALLQVAGRAQGKGRAEVREDLDTTLEAAGIRPEPVVVGGFTDSILRAARSSLVVETDDGVVLGRFQGDAPGVRPSARPATSGPEDRERPTSS